MRYYLDTNILAFLYTEDADGDIAPEIREIIDEYENMLFVSSVCVHELIHLVQIGKVRPPKGAPDVATWLDEANIRMAPVDRHHLARFEALPFVGDHRDPFDRLIVAQAISDRTPIISSDRKFALYERHGLEFIYNRR